MSSIDLSNPKVLANHVRAQIEEGKGTVSRREEVFTFITDGGIECVVPEDLVDKYPQIFKKKLATQPPQQITTVSQPEHVEGDSKPQADIGLLREKYIAAHPQRKRVPPTYMNNREWIEGKIKEFLGK